MYSLFFPKRFYYPHGLNKFQPHKTTNTTHSTVRHILSCHPLTLSSLPAPIANVSYPLLSLYCNYLSTAGTVCPTSHSHQHAPTGRGRVCSILISDHDKIYCDCHPWCVGLCSDSDLPASAQNTCVKDMRKHTHVL